MIILFVVPVFYGFQSHNKPKGQTKGTVLLVCALLSLKIIMFSSLAEFPICFTCHNVVFFHLHDSFYSEKY